MSWSGELRRRNVLRMALLYVAGGWLLLQVADVLIGVLGLSDALLPVVGMVLLAGFPLALALSWFYRLTPEGLKRELDADEAGSLASRANPAANFAIIAVLGLGVALLLVDRYLLEDTEASLPQDGLAILPFESLGADQSDRALAAGIHEELLSEASRLAGLKVTSRTSVSRIDPTLSVRDIGKTLGVSHVLEGSFRRQGESIRVTVQLIDSRTDDHVWAENFDGTLNDVFALQEDMARQIARELNVEVGSGRRHKAPDGEAYALFVEARGLLERPLGETQAQHQADAMRALDLLERAVELDPSFADAWALLSGTLYWESDEQISHGRPLEEIQQQAREMRQMAVSLDPRSPLVQMTMALNTHGEEQVRHFEQVLELDPNHVDAMLGLGSIYAARYGETEGYRDMVELALDVDPLNAHAHDHYARLLRAEGRYDQALAHARRAESMGGFGFGISYIYWSQNNLARHIQREVGRAENFQDPDNVCHMPFVFTRIDLSGDTSERWIPVAEASAPYAGPNELGIRICTKSNELYLAVMREDFDTAQRLHAELQELRSPDYPLSDGYTNHRAVDDFQWFEAQHRWAAGEQQALIDFGRDQLERWLTSLRAEHGNESGFSIRGERDIRGFATAARLAYALGDRDLERELWAPVEAFLDRGGYVGDIRNGARWRARILLARDDFDGALQQYRTAFEHGLDLHREFLEFKRETFVDRRLEAFYFGDAFQALLERNRAHREREMRRLEAESPELVYPDTQDIIQRLLNAQRDRVAQNP